MADERLGASFSIDVTNLKAGLAQANRLIRESESEFRAAAAGMEDWTESEEGLTKKLHSLNKIADLQKEKVKALETQYKEAGYAQDDMSSAAVQMRIDINKAKEALAKSEAETKKYEDSLEELKDGSGKAEKALDDLRNETDNVSDGFSVAKGAIANLVSDGISSFVGGCKDAIGALLGLADATAEYREDIGKLETAFETAGFTTEQAKDVYKDFYAILGEEDRSVEAVNHLAQFVETEQDLATWSEIATGVLGTFGDSLPIEGLTEAA